MKNKRVPYPDEIDPKVKLVDLPLYKYDKNDNHKIFVTNLFKYSYIITTHFGDGYNDISGNSADKYLFDDKIIELNKK